jgi:uncharacterized protein HemX
MLRGNLFRSFQLSQLFGAIMKKLLSLCAVSFVLSMGAAPAAFAADGAKPAQQSKMAVCNKDAEGKKGDERKAFMKECLSAKAAPATQQSKMKTCNVEAKGKKGDERKAFMKECLSA